MHVAVFVVSAEIPVFGVGCVDIMKCHTRSAGLEGAEFLDEVANLADS